jgi:hypothetical protein
LQCWSARRLLTSFEHSSKLAHLASRTLPSRSCSAFS